MRNFQELQLQTGVTRHHRNVLTKIINSNKSNRLIKRIPSLSFKVISNSQNIDNIRHSSFEIAVA